MAQEIVLADLWRVVAVHLFLQVISRIAKRSLVSFCLTFSLFPPCFAMSTPPALPAPGGNATAALALVTASQPEEVVIHSGAATTEGDMSYQEEDFDPCRYDPRRDMPGVLDANIDISQLNTINFNNIDHRTAHVAVVQQGVDPTVASHLHLMAAQQHAFQSEANTLRL